MEKQQRLIKVNDKKVYRDLHYYLKGPIPSNLVVH